MNFWLVMLFAGLVTYAIRLSFILFIGRRRIPTLLLRALRFVPPAVLTAIIFPEVVMPGGNLNLSFENPRLLSGLLAVVVAWRTRNVMLTILVGMLTLWVLQYYFL
jgi:branched-subunit amino acid transport protein